METITIKCPHCNEEITLGMDTVKDPEEEIEIEEEIKVTISKDDECNLFRAVIDSYGVKASYGDRQTMTTDKPFVDEDDCFRNGAVEYKQEDIAPYWKKTVFGEFQFDENNPRIARLIEDGVLTRPFSY